MRCEVCGQEIHGKPVKAIIEGAKLTVCSECSRHGKIVWEELKQAPPMPEPKTLTVTRLRAQSAGKPSENVKENLELTEGFSVKIRQAREKLGLTHEELGKRISEKVSVLKKIEAGKMTPDNRLAAKLEHALKIKLLVPVQEVEITKETIPKPPSREVTLGDIAQLNKGKLEEKT